MTCVMASDVNQTGNFTKLNSMINDADDNANLTNDYECIEGDGDLSISKSITIHGNGHSLKNNNASIVLSEDNSNIIFENIDFLDRPSIISNNTHFSNITFINCKFEPVNSTQNNTINFDRYTGILTSGEISPNVKLLAKLIVGKSKGLKAAKILAKWVGKSIEHETAEGFYQTAEMTLFRKCGNCCSQTDLFLQMCVAVGLDKNHKLGYVHVGTMMFGKRHFFAMIDNVLVDVDAKSNSPWGHANIGDRDFYRITEYPYLPLPREY